MKGEQLSKELHVKMKLLLDWTAVPAASYIHLVQLVPQLKSSLKDQMLELRFKQTMLLMCKSFSGPGIWIRLSRKITAIATDLTWRLFSKKVHIKMRYNNI